jgi:hypothetical protein
LPARTSEVESLTDEINILLDKLWAKTMNASDGSDWICYLCTCFGREAVWGRETYAKDDQIIPILQVIQGSIYFGSCEEHQAGLKAYSIGQEGIRWSERSSY